MNEKLKEKVKESLSSVLPITLIVLVLSVTLVPMEIGTLALFLTGAVLLIVGMGFFQLGAEMSMTPLGEGVGKTLAKREKVLLVVLVAFALGTIITIAEPDLQVLANQVASIPNNVLIWTVAVGVGVFLALAVLRILFRVSLAKCLLAAYALLFVLTLFSRRNFSPSRSTPAASRPGPSPCRLSWRWASACQPSAARRDTTTTASVSSRCAASGRF